MAKLRIAASKILQDATGAEAPGCHVIAARYIPAADAIEIEIDGSDVPDAEYVAARRSVMRDAENTFKTVFEGFVAI